MPSLTNPFHVDLRALAVMRMCVGMLLLADLAVRLPDLGWFLSETGVLSGQASRAYADHWRLSLYWLNTSSVWAAILFGVAALAALMLAMGMRTRVASVLSFVLLVSLHNRNPLLLQGGDNLLLLLTFWGMFLPWGARWSVDAAMSAEVAPSNRYAGIGAAAILLQVLSVYFFSAFLKNAPEWTTDGTAIYYALHNDQYVDLLGPLWRDWHSVTIPLTHYVWWLELLGPVVALSPVFNVWARFIAAFCFITLELGFLSSLNVGHFPFISLTSLLIVLPAPLWDGLQRLVAVRGDSSVTFYYDQGCDFCRKACLVIRALIAPKSSVLPAQSHPEVGPLLEREFSWVVETQGGRYLRSEALEMAVRHGGRVGSLAKPLRLLRAPGDLVYGFVGRHRGGFGKFTALLMPWREQRPQPGKFAQAFTAIFLVIVLVWNISTIPALQSPLAGTSFEPAAVQTRLGPVIRLFRLDQIWNMFAPRPAVNDGWFMMAGLTPEGELLDVLEERIGVPNATKPEHFIPEQAANFRWRKYLTRMMEPGFTQEWGNYGAARCRDWNQRAAREPGWPQLEEFNVYFIEERTPPMNKVGKLSFALLWRHQCFDMEKLENDAVQKALLDIE